MLVVAHFFIALDPPTPIVVVSFNIFVIINPLLVFPEEEETEEEKKAPLAAARFLPSLAANDKNIVLSLSLSLSVLIEGFFFCLSSSSSSVSSLFLTTFRKTTTKHQRNKITATNQNLREISPLCEISHRKRQLHFLPIGCGHFFSLGKNNLLLWLHMYKEEEGRRSCFWMSKE